MIDAFRNRKRPFAARPVFTPWIYPAITLLLAPGAAHIGGALHWSVGAASLAILAIPTCLASLSGARWASAVTVLAAAVGCVLESGCLLGHRTGLPDWGFAMLSVGLLIGMSNTIVNVVESLQRTVDHLGREQRRRDHARGDQSRRDAPLPPAAPLHEGLSSPLTPEGPAVAAVNYPMLLLSLQDVGRKISTHLDFDTLLPTIVGTAEHVLKASYCQVFLWEPGEQTFRATGVSVQPRVSRPPFVPRADRGVGLWLIKNRHVITRRDIEREYALRSLLDGGTDIPDALAPLAVGDELLGILAVHNVEEDDQTFARLLYIVANFSALALKNAQLFGRLQDLARRDGLTGLFNRGAFQERLGQMAEQAAQHAQPLTVILCDLDHFKRINDEHGHLAGDHVLRAVSGLWKAVVPESGFLARYGGEEFVCVLPETPLMKGAELAEILRHELEHFPIFFEGQEFQVTASLGVADLGHVASSAEKVIRAADEALYNAKRLGRNRVCTASALVAPMPLERAEALRLGPRVHPPALTLGGEKFVIERPRECRTPVRAGATDQHHESCHGARHDSSARETPGPDS